VGCGLMLEGKRERVVLGRVVVEVPCTCGELVQGISEEGSFLVSCPIDVYSRVEAALTAASEVVGPRERGKAIAAARLTLAHLGCEGVGVALEIGNPLPASRGFGTSTADIVGAIAATAGALGYSLAPTEIAELAIRVEPSDSSMFPGLALLDHRSGSRWELLGDPPSLAIAVLDFGGAVDTVDYNAALDCRRLQEFSYLHVEALGLLRKGIANADPWAVGAAAFKSALANQELLPKAYLVQALALARRLGGYGVCAAHSGTALGLLLPPDSATVAGALEEARRTLPGLEAAWAARLVGGGVRVITASARTSFGAGYRCQRALLPFRWHSSSRNHGQE